MISISKLQKLPKKIRLRKCVLIFQEAEDILAENKQPDLVYLLDVASIVEESIGLSQGELLHKKIAIHINQPNITFEAAIERRGPKNLKNIELTNLLRACNRARHKILTYLGAQPAEWDLFSKPFKPRANKYPMNLFLEDIRSPYNVGAIFRSAAAFGIEKIYLSPDTASPDHIRAKRSAMGCVDLVPWERIDLQMLVEHDLFVLELGGTALESFAFPSQGIMIVGSEELGISPEALDLAEKSKGRVSIPLPGVKGSLNVSVACGIVLHWWYQSVYGTICDNPEK